MADQPEPMAQRIAYVLPLALPVLGGLVAVFLTNHSEANPFIWIVVGVILGRLLAYLLVKPLEAMADRQRNLK